MALQGAPRAEPAASVDQFMSSFLSAVIKIFTDPSPVSSLLRSSFFTHQRLLNISSFLFILINVLWCKCYRPVAQFLPSEGKGFPYCRHTHTHRHTETSPYHSCYDYHLDRGINSVTFISLDIKAWWASTDVEMKVSRT